MNNHSIGKTIAELRKIKGWTQAELAEKLNVSDKAVSKWESESGLPEILQLPTMASLFDVSIDYLMTGNEPKKEILLMSKAEFCAKNDDISLAEEVKGLPKDEYNKGNKEMVIIKLCVRMEAILKCDYHYEGDFSEMLDRFRDHNNSNCTKMLNDLRKQRNGIVHSEKSLSPMPDEEIKQCIEYICTL